MFTFWVSRWPSLSMLGSKRIPGVPRGTRMQLRPSRPPFSLSVRTVTVFTLAPLRSQPAAFDGQYLWPLSTYAPLARSCTAVVACPTGCGSGWSKLAVPPGAPGGSLMTQPARYSPVRSLVASPSHFFFCSLEPNQTSGISAIAFPISVQAKPGSTAQISSIMICRSTLLAPPPPYSLGIGPMTRPSLYAST